MQCAQYSEYYSKSVNDFLRPLVPYASDIVRKFQLYWFYYQLGDISRSVAYIM